MAARRPAAKKPATAKPTQRTTAKATATKATAKKLSAREAAYQVLRASKEPLKVDEILKRIAKKGVVLAGTTPAATLAAVMYTHPEQFEKMAPGLFRANPDYLRGHDGREGDPTRPRSAHAVGTAGRRCRRRC